jgi:hypothetical protein
MSPVHRTMPGLYDFWRLDQPERGVVEMESFVGGRAEGASMRVG